jgi:tetratricopeptide (TPR) repeat protein
LCRAAIRGEVRLLTMRPPLLGGRRLWVLLLLLAGPTLLSIVWAAPLPAGQNTAQRMEAIRQRMEQGQSLYVGKSYQQAAQVFEDGYAAYPYSAFLFNAGVCYQKLETYERALAKFRDYLRVDPNAPDAAKVSDRIAALEAALAARAAEAGAPDAGPEAPPADGGESADAGLPDAGPPPVIVPDDDQAMKSLVVVETDPVGAPLKMYQRVRAQAPAFQLGGANAGWVEVAATQSPANFTLAVGRYHVVVEKFRDYNVSHTDIEVQAGHVHQFKANLSQGEFMAFLRIAANVKGAHLYLDDKAKQRPEWGVTPHGELVPAGQHEVLIEAPGFKPMTARVQVTHGEQKELEVSLARLDYGIVRLHSNADVSVSLDGEPKGDYRIGGAPLEFRASSGAHQLSVTSADRKDFEGMIEVPPGQVLPVHATMIQKYPRGGAWMEAVFGAALIGGGAVAGTLSNSLHDDLTQDRRAGTLEESDSRKTAGTWLAVGANVGFAGGAVLLGLATYNFIKDPLPPSSTQLDKPLEFDDPATRRPTAQAPRKTAPAPARRANRPAPALHVGAAPAGVGLGLGGKF